MRPFLAGAAIAMILLFIALLPVALSSRPVPDSVFRDTSLPPGI
jgi:hypothetical protein